jgi:predicted ATPase
MLTSLQLKNFKCWRDTKPIKMAPLTVLFGTNSSGKSSIEQFFLMLKQTMESSDRKIVLYPGDVNTPVNLGSFEDLVFARDASNKLEFNFEWSLARPLTVRKPSYRWTPDRWSGANLRFSAEIGMMGKEPQKLAVGGFDYQLKDNSKQVMRVSVKRKAGDKAEYELDASPYELTRSQGRPWPLGAPTKFYGFPDQILEYYQNAQFVQDFSLRLEQLLRSISYLGPLRSKGQRLYYWPGGEPESVGYSGENTISALLAAKDRKLNTGKGKKKKPFGEFIAERLHQLELIDGFEVKQISAHRKEYEVKVKTPGSQLLVDLPDVGFGVSQVLPVLVQCFYAPANSILFIEQPELHLHPKAQSNLADLFIDVISSRENSEDRNIQLVIETHSEHFLHRLQRRIAEDDLQYPIKTEQVAAYFAHCTATEFQLQPLPIDRFGNISNWPENFFGDEMGDLMRMAQAGAERQALQAESTSNVKGEH